jgi:negative regulator of sigma-B (phosphoserine phosphatase)
MSFRTAHVSIPKAGEKENGDAVLVRSDEPDRLMLAVVDGLGHGAAAAQASRKATARLAALSWDLTMLDVMVSLHQELSGTIAASATVCLIRGRMLEACAVGNVQLACSGSDVPLVPSAGVLGRRVSKFNIGRAELRSRSWLALFSDGISRRLSLAAARNLTPEAACKAFVARFRQRDDDATILVCSVED